MKRCQAGDTTLGRKKVAEGGLDFVVNKLMPERIRVTAVKSGHCGERVGAKRRPVVDVGRAGGGGLVAN